MKIKIDKKYTEGYQIDRVKEDIAVFKERYTEIDILRVLNGQVKNLGFVEIANMSIEAMDSGFAWGNVTLFHIEMLLKGRKKYIEASFYAGVNLEINAGSVEIQEYTLTHSN